MRALSTALQAAVAAGTVTPDVTVELLDQVPHYSAVYSGGPQGRNAAVIAADGALVQVYNDQAGRVYVRRVVDPTQANWGALAWTTLSSTSATRGVVGMARLSDRLRVFWQDGVTTHVLAADSFDNGATWGAGAVLFDAGGAVAGIACDGNSTPVFVQYEAAANVWRVAAWSFGTGWVKADWTNGDSYDAGGIGVVQNPDASYRVAVVLQATATSGATLQLCTLGVGVGGWSVPDVLVPDDLGAGLALGDPHVALYDGRYHLSYTLIDSGAVSGLPATRAAVAHSLDGVHWTDPLEDGNSYYDGAVALKHASGYFLVAPDVAALAPLYVGSASQYRDCTADVADVRVTQEAGKAASLTLRLENETGQYVGLAALRPNARIRLSLGYAGAGVVPTHLLSIETYQYSSAVDQKDVVLVARDALAWLERESRSALVYSNRTVDWLAREVLARAGLLVVQLPATPQFSQVVPSFSIPAGSTWRRALDRLSRVYGFTVVARTQADGTDLVAVVELSPSDAVVWSYGGEADALQVATSGKRANHVLVYGAPSTPAVIGEAWDFVDSGSVGQERCLHAVEPMITTRTGAGIRATLQLDQEKRAALAGRLDVALHPGLEALDVVTVSDAVVPATTARVRTLRHAYEPGRGVYTLSLGLEGV